MNNYRPAHILLLIAATLLLLASCARIGSPDGGWFDEDPPYVFATSPRENATNFNGKRIYLLFNEYIKMDNDQEKIVVSPPQIEQPEIKVQGKRIRVELKDSLIPNQTYTIDFSDAISDNNEGNPLGNYTFTFSTYDRIDTMEVSGYLIEAETLEPIKGLLVGLYDAEDFPSPTLSPDSAALPTDSLAADSARNAFQPDTIFRTKPMLRVARSDDRGHFVVKGVAKDKQYRVFALEDMDGNYRFTQKAEKIAFTDRLIKPGAFLDNRRDTIWQDALRIKDVVLTPYTHFTPDDIVLRVFQETLTERHLLKTERKDPERIDVYFTYGHDSLPKLTPLNFEAEENINYLVEHSLKKDTVTYWLSDSVLINNDSLLVELRYFDTDTLGVLQEKADTIELAPKTSFEKRQKQKEEEYKKWKKEQEKLMKKEKPYQTEMPRPTLSLKWDAPGVLAPNQHIYMTSPVPIALIDTSKIHLKEKVDTLWEERPFIIERDTLANRQWRIVFDKTSKQEFSLEVDSFAVRDIYDRLSTPQKSGVKIGGEEDYGTLSITLQGLQGRQFIVQLLSGGDKVAAQVITQNSSAKFLYLKPGDYYMRLIVDDNEDGIYTTGLYDENRQPEQVFFYHEAISVKAKWDKELAWSPYSRPLYQQKPSKLVKQKAAKKKTTQVGKNMQRAKEYGYKFLPDGTPVQ